MRIDAHQHFWIYSPQEYGWIDDSMDAIRRNFLPEDLVPELQQNGYAGSVAVQARQTLDETRHLLSLADQDERILGVVGWVDLCSREVRSQLSKFSDHSKFVGVRHIVQSEPDERFLLREDFKRGIAALEEFDLAYDILIYTKHLPVAAEFVEKFPRQRFVLDHMAKPPIKAGQIERWADGVRRLAQFPKVLCKLSGLVTEADWHNWKTEQIVPYLDIAFEAFGPERLMIGSDWPVCLVAASYTTAMNVVQNWIRQFRLETQEAILGQNAQRFWKLPAEA
jgi:L-fuconolactonase